MNVGREVFRVVAVAYFEQYVRDREVLSGAIEEVIADSRNETYDGMIRYVQVKLYEKGYDVPFRIGNYREVTGTIRSIIDKMNK